MSPPSADRRSPVRRALEVVTAFIRNSRERGVAVFHVNPGWAGYEHDALATLRRVRMASVRAERFAGACCLNELPTRVVLAPFKITSTKFINAFEGHHIMVHD
jgi:hypothetical protein